MVQGAGMMKILDERERERERERESHVVQGAGMMKILKWLPTVLHKVSMPTAIFTRPQSNI